MRCVNPIAGEVTSGYSDDRPHPVSGTIAPHWGNDVAGRPRGAARHAVGAIADGVVLEVRNDSYPGDKRPGLLRRLTGNGVSIDHGRDELGRSVVSYVGHGVNIAVRPGDVVRAGQRVCDQGATGVVAGAHVHLEVWLDGRTVDPLPFLAARDVVLGAGPTTLPPLSLTTTTTEETTMRYWIATEKNTGRAYIGNLITRRHIKDLRELEDLRVKMVRDGVPVHDAGEVERIGWLGVDVTA